MNIAQQKLGLVDAHKVTLEQGACSRLACCLSADIICDVKVEAQGRDTLNVIVPASVPAQIFNTLADKAVTLIVANADMTAIRGREVSVHHAAFKLI